MLDIKSSLENLEKNWIVTKKYIFRFFRFKCCLHYKLNDYRVNFTETNTWLNVIIYSCWKNIFLFNIKNTKQSWESSSRSSHQRSSIKKGALKNFAIFTGTHLCWSLFLLKLKAFTPFSQNTSVRMLLFFCNSALLLCFLVSCLLCFIT